MVASKVFLSINKSNASLIDGTIISIYFNIPT